MLVDRIDLSGVVSGMDDEGLRTRIDASYIIAFNGRHHVTTMYTTFFNQ